MRDFSKDLNEEPGLPEQGGLRPCIFDENIGPVSAFLVGHLCVHSTPDVGFRDVVPLLDPAKSMRFGCVNDNHEIDERIETGLENKCSFNDSDFPAVPPLAKEPRPDPSEDCRVKHRFKPPQQPRSTENRLRHISAIQCTVRSVGMPAKEPEDLLPHGGDAPGYILREFVGRKDRDPVLAKDAADCRLSAPDSTRDRDCDHRHSVSARARRT